MTKIDLCTLQKEVLCRGVDFGIPKISEPDVLVEFELVELQVTQLIPVSMEAAERSRCELAAVAREFGTTKPDPREFSLRREHRKTLKELRKTRSW